MFPLRLATCNNRHIFQFYGVNRARWSSEPLQQFDRIHFLRVDVLNNEDKSKSTDNSGDPVQTIPRPVCQCFISHNHRIGRDAGGRRFTALNNHQYYRYWVCTIKLHSRPEGDTTGIRNGALCSPAGGSGVGGICSLCLTTVPNWSFCALDRFVSFIDDVRLLIVALVY